MHVAVQQYSEQCVFKYMNSNEGLKYEIYPRYCFVHCCNHLPEKVQSTCRLISYYPIHSVSHPEIKKKGTCTRPRQIIDLLATDKSR